MENLSLIFLSAAILVGLVYGLFCLSQGTSWKRSFLKTFPVALLSMSALSAGLPTLLTVALCLSAAGDAFLSRTSNKAFIAGLGSFLLAHVAYTVLFWDNPASIPTSSVLTLSIWLLTILLIISVLISLWHHLGPMKPAVFVYSLAIGSMNIAAWTTGQNYLLLMGVTLFIFSDIVLAHEIFVWKNIRAKNIGSIIVWFSYFPAQVLILYSYF